ncbi:hypothetical protein SynMEDNS5_01714 [Synechococcus sp. MEDNS5]|uniref:hypothetical protein n=1 Tax=Synechococcus sp. MEDNS5 TaxID=1442554 RepID=UPI000B6342B8|nr:hypothetical protein [Synechococcus sp. MEDNS5]OUX73592.1 MAG: hypothetical protein CBC50_02925 [Synechococcus sp. TMED90]QNJ06429.1 hypothetical protein SynMEDNS5_01714 [Synechococcus sp. MEDNS5]|tara:strand:+ start:33 stop:407 length:375 start_codon:yes stop_codon:yes gene_type:complete
MAFSRSTVQILAGASSALALLAFSIGELVQPAQAADSETRQALVGLAAYAECKVLRSGYSRARAQAIVQSGIKSNGWQQQAEWLKSPQAIRLVALTSEAMNTTCDDFDQNSPDFIPAMKALDAL